MNKSQSGFTLVELVVVILILGILGATALPRFMNVNTQAHEAAVSGAGGGLGAGVALAHAQWIANASTGAVTDVAGFGDGTVAVNASGWPTSTAADKSVINADTDCNEVWLGVMQNPPSLGATPGDYTVTRATTQCIFTYNAATGMTITYESNNGTVLVDDVI